MPEPGIRPGGRVTFFASPKKVSKERRPHCLRPLRFAAGQPAVLAHPACRRTRDVHFVHSAQTAAASPTTKHACPSAGMRPAALRSSAQPEGVGSGSGRRFARPSRIPTTKNPSTRHGAYVFNPLCAHRAPQVARSEVEGHAQWGRLFFAYFLLAKQKKVSRPPGRIPGSGLQQQQRTKQRQVPPPQPSPRGGGSKAAPPPCTPHQNKGKSQSTGSMPTPALVLTGRGRWVQSPIEIHHPGETDDHAPAPHPAMRSPRDRTPVRRHLRPDQGTHLRAPGHAGAAAPGDGIRRGREGHRLQDQLAHVRRAAAT